MDINPKVVDLSHYDDVETAAGQWLGFKKLYAAGYRGVINKASQGPGMVDVSYARRRPHALAAGLLYGAYHYLTPGDPALQAKHFLDVAQPDDKTLLALDHETRGVSLDAAWIFMEVVKVETGRYPWLYSGFLIKEQLGMRKDPFWAQVKLWLSHYNANPKWPPTWDKPTLWQFTGDGVGPMPHDAPGVTIPGGCDINSFDGTDDELTRVWAT